MNYTVTRTMLGRSVVEYLCDRCGMDLKSPLASAGLPERCPRCDHRFTCPGVVEKEAEEESERIAVSNQQQIESARQIIARQEAVKSQALARKRQDAYQARFNPVGPSIICPNVHCGYVGPAAIRRRGSPLFALLLMLAFLIPGVLYWIFACRPQVICPSCGLKIRDD